MTDKATNSYYERHIFFCLNERDPGENSCGPHGARKAYEHCKGLVKRAGLSQPGKGTMPPAQATTQGQCSDRAESSRNG